MMDFSDLKNLLVKARELAKEIDRRSKEEPNTIRLLVAARNGRGVVLEAYGDDWEYWLEYDDADEDGLKNAPDGISIWEGRLIPGWGPDHNGEYDGPELKGEYKPLTPNDWQALSEGRSVFP